MESHTLQSILVNTYNPDARYRQEAEVALNQFLLVPGSCLVLLNLVGDQTVVRDLRLAAVLVLKNKIEGFWTEADGLCITVEEKALFKSNIVEILLNETDNSIKGLLSDIIRTVSATDYPELWPGLVPGLVSNLQPSGAPMRMFNALLALRKVAKRFEHKHGDQIGPLNYIIEAAFPILQSNLLPLALGSNDIGAAQILRISFKLFWSCTSNTLPTSPAVNAQAWFDALSQVMDKVLPEAEEGVEPIGQPKDLDERAMWPWWKAKKWACKIMLMFIQRYGNPRYCASDHKSFSTYFRENTSIQFLTSVIRMLLVKSGGRYVSPAVTRMCIGYLSASVELSPTFKIIKQHLDMVLFQILFPTLCVTDEEIAMVEDDPSEYIKSVLEPGDDWMDARTAAIDLLVNLAKYRQKDLFPKFLPFIQSILAEYMAAPPVTRNYKNKDGSILAVASVADIFRSNKDYSSLLPSFISAHILPEFTSPIAFLKARAVWSIQRFSESDYGKDQAVLQSTMAGLLQSLRDAAVPVQTAAANSIGVLVEVESTAAILEPLVPQLIGEYLRIVQETENMEVLVTLQTIVGKFGEVVKPMALDIVSHLQGAFQEFAKDDDETGSVFSASQCLETIVSLIDICQEDAPLLSQMEIRLSPLMFQLLRDGQHSFEYLTTCLDMVGYFTYFADDFSEGMWQLCGAMLEAINDWAFDFMNEMLSPLLTFLIREAPTFLRLQHKGTPYVNLYLTSIQRGFEATLSEIEHDARVAATMLSCLFVSVGVSAPGSLDSLMPALTTGYLTRLGISKRKVLRLQLLEVGLASLFYNPMLTLQVMSSLDPAVVQTFFTELLANLKNLTREMSRRLLVYAFMRILTCPTEQLPPLIAANLVPIHREMLKAAVWLEEESTKEDSFEDEDGDEEDEFSNFDGADDDVDAAGLRAVRRAMRSAGLAGIPDSGFDEDEDCLNDENEAFEEAMKEMDEKMQRRRRARRGTDEDDDEEDDEDDDLNDFSFTMPEPLLDSSAFVLSQYQVIRAVNSSLEQSLLSSLSAEEIAHLESLRVAVAQRNEQQTA